MSDEIDLARGWLAKAVSDIHTARLLVTSSGPYDTACFHAQQAIEKALKGFLALHRQPIPRTHDWMNYRQHAWPWFRCRNWQRSI